MRVSTPNLVQNSQIGIESSLARIAAAQAQIASGRRLERPSDDPAGFTQSQDLSVALGTMEQYRANGRDASAFMSVTDVALGQALGLVRQARTYAIQAGNASLDANARQSIAAQISNIVQQLGALGNSTHGSKYLFGGQHTTNAPFVASGESWQYVGGTAANGNDALIIEVSQGDYMRINVTGDTTLEPTISALVALRDHVLSGDTHAISTEDLASLDRALQSIQAQRADLGAKIQRLDQTGERLDKATQQLTEIVSRIVDADIPKVVMEMKTAELAYQAALAAGARQLQLSLLDYLR